MAHVARDRKKLLTRVRRLRGQVEALERTLSADPDCFDTLTQIAAIRGATQGLMLEILDDHLREHIGEEKNAAKRNAEIAAVQTLLRSYFK